MKADVEILADEARHLRTCLERDAERLRLLNLAIAGLAAQGRPECAASAVEAAPAPAESGAESGEGRQGSAVPSVEADPATGEDQARKGVAR